MTFAQYLVDLSASQDFERKLKLLGDKPTPEVQAALARVQAYADTFAKAQRAIRKGQKP